jgi:hypothetical protein
MLTRLHGKGRHALGNLREALKEIERSFAVACTPGTP